MYVTKLFCPRRHKNEYHLTNQTEGKRWHGLTPFQIRWPTMPDLPFFCQTVVVIRPGRCSYMFSFYNNFYINLFMLRKRQEAVCGEKMNFLLRFFFIVVVFSWRKKTKTQKRKKISRVGGPDKFHTVEFLPRCAWHGSPSPQLVDKIFKFLLL